MILIDVVVRERNDRSNLKKMMKRKLHIAIILTLSLVWLILPQGLCLGAKYYYVDINNPKASDSNPGTSDEPWRTFQRALPNYVGSGPIVTQGDTVYVASGTYPHFSYSESTADTGRTEWIDYIGDADSNPVFPGFEIHVTGNAYMRFHNLNVQQEANPGRWQASLDIGGGGDPLIWTSYIQFYNCTFQNTDPAAFDGHSVKIKYVDNIWFEDCKMLDGQNNGLLGAGSNVTIKNCQFLNQWGDHLTIYGKLLTGWDGILIEGCLFSGLKPVYGYTTNSYHMDVLDLGLGSIKNLIVRGNTFIVEWDEAYQDWEGLDPAGVEYGTITPGLDGTFHHCAHMGQIEGANYTFENNLVYGTVRSDWRIESIRSDCTGVVVRNNTIILDSWFPSHKNRITGATGAKNYNNIWGGNLAFQMDSAGASQNNNIYAAYDVNSNIEIGSNSTELGQAGAEALFVDFANDDFRLAEDSLAIDFGDPAHSPATDILGNRRDAQPDAGCYEYVLAQDELADKPDKTKLECYNNVFNPTKGEEALIWIELPNQAHIRLDLYNTRGNRIRELVDKEEDPGPCRYYWNGRDDSGNVVGSGLYFVHIQAGDYRKTKKIVVVK